MTQINIQRREQELNIDSATRTYHLPIASDTQLGGIKVGENLSIEEDGTLNAASGGYTLPTASAITLGGIKVGSNLSMSNGTLSVPVDTTLNSVSNNPIANSTINSALTSLTSTVQNNTTSISNLNTSLGNLTNTVNGHTSTLSTLSDTVSSQGDDISANTSAISDTNDTVSTLSDNLTALTTRVGTAEDDIDTIENDIADINSSISDLEELTDTEHTYSYLLPVSTWTAGSITLERRGKMGLLTVDIEGDLTIASGNSSIIFSFTDLNLFLPTSNVLLSDDGTIIGKVDDQTNNFTLENITAHSIHITKLQGSIPLVFF